MDGAAGGMSEAWSGKCDVCGAPQSPVFYLAGTFVIRCEGCGLYELGLVDLERRVSMLDSSQVGPALSALRAANFSRILDRLESSVPRRDRRVLDVGCGSGQFVAMARARGWEAWGIDPDPGPQPSPLPGEIVRGFFPHDLPPDWHRFDVITFNDVFEHLPRPVEVLQQCRGLLRQGGLISLALPSSEGFVFRLARLAYHAGLVSPLERLFQINYPHPHLYYFGSRSLEALAHKAGLEIRGRERLRSFCRRGVLARARMDRALDPFNAAKRYVTAGLLYAAAVLEPLFPPDSLFVLLGEKTRSADGG